jgi:SAM-dependent MidA family methyltransferase
MFLPFDELQKQVNERYYKRRGRKLYSDFKTFGSSDKIARANARDFYLWLQENDDGSEIRVYDFGIGNGLFSKFFLEELAELDKTNLYSSRLSYFICDLSEELIKKAEADLEMFGVEGIICDATGKLPFLKGASHIRSNEMYDDLPAKIYVRQGKELREVIMNDKQKKEYVAAANAPSAIRKFMQLMPEGYEVPINLGAEKHLRTCLTSLRNGGYADFLDYGFASVQEMRELPQEMFNNSIVREFNTQLTIDVNFAHLADVARDAGAAAEILPQKDYAEKVLGEKLYYLEFEQLYYLNAQEVAANKKKMKKFGYPDDFLTNGVREQDDYKLLRARK